MSNKGYYMIPLQDLKEMLPNPIDTISRLDEYIIGQEDAKKSLAVMLLNRGILKLNRAGLLEIEVPLQKANVLLLGPSGTGKTALMRALGEIADVPITVFDVTSITSGAYIGNKVEDILVEHVNNCYEYVRSNLHRLQEYQRSALDSSLGFETMVIECIETGIVYIDEIDKTREMKDTGGQGASVQSELLKILEEGEVALAPSRRPVVRGAGVGFVNTRDIVFVGGGAFHGLSDIIKRRLSNTSGMGFSADIRKGKAYKDSEYFRHVTTKDLVDYGFKTEFLGRLPLRSVLDPLSKEALIEIMKYSRNSVLTQYKEVFKVFHINLEVEKLAYSAIADLALDLETGARSLKAILNNILMDEFCNVFSHTGSRLVITPEMVNNKARPNV